MATATRGSGLALERVRVADLTSVWAGPLCTRLLADMGAEVIKIESPKRPDGTRSNPGYFSWLNWNKLGVTLDLNVARAKECFKQLVATCDVVVENFSPRVMRNFELHYPVLKKVNPRIIMLSMPAFGSDGPYENRVAYGPGLEASSALASLTGYENGAPMLSGSALGDPVAGLHGALAVLAALRFRRLFGKGQWIDLAQREALSQMFGEAFLLAARGITQRRSGVRRSNMAPHGCYRCFGEDRWVAIAIRSDDEWERLCQVIGKPQLASDPRYADLAARKANEDEQDREIEAWTREKEREEVMRLLQDARVPAGVVADARDLSGDPHLASRSFFHQMADFEGKLCHFPDLPWKGTAEPQGIRRPAPRLGEHNREVLAGILGLSDDEIEETQGATGS